MWAGERWQIGQRVRRGLQKDPLAWKLLSSCGVVRCAHSAELRGQIDDRARRSWKWCMENILKNLHVYRRKEKYTTFPVRSGRLLFMF